MAEFTENDLDRIEPEWERIFGERMPRSFEVGPAQVPILRCCIEQRSMQPLHDYLRTIPDDIAYCKNDKPIADLVPQAREGKRKLGFLKGQVEVPDEALFVADAKIKDMFYGIDGCES